LKTSSTEFRTSVKKRFQPNAITTKKPRSPELTEKPINGRRSAEELNIPSPVTSKRGNISSNTQGKRGQALNSVYSFNVSFHYDLPFLLRVSHLNNTFSEFDRLAPLLTTRRAHSRAPELACAREWKLRLVHVKHCEWSRVPILSFLPPVATRAKSNDRDTSFAKLHSPTGRRSGM